MPVMAVRSLESAGRCWLVMGDFVGRVKVVDVASKRVIWDIRAHTRMVNSIAVNVTITINTIKSLQLNNSIKIMN